MQNESVVLHCTSGGSDKVYAAWLTQVASGWEVNFRYGRRVPGPGFEIQGNAGGTKTPSPVTYERASNIYKGLIGEKQAKAYTIVSSSTGSVTESVIQSQTAEAREKSGIVPMLLVPIADEKTAVELFDNPSYCMQEKFDGERRLIYKTAMERARGINRKGEFVELPVPVRDHAAYLLAASYIMDGEVIGDSLVVFDLLALNGEYVRKEPFQVRFDRLRQIGMGAAMGAVRSIRPAPTVFTKEHKRALFHQVKARGGEGVVFKLIAAPYVGGLSKYVRKFKFTADGTFTVISVSAGKRSVQLAARTEEGVQPVGSVTIPVNHDIPVVGSLVETRYLYAFPNGGSLFQPVYGGLRTDKDEADLYTGLKFKKASDEDDEEAAA